MNYRSRHKSMSAWFTKEEHEKFCEIAAKHDRLPSQYATDLLRREMETEAEKEPA